MCVRPALFTAALTFSLVFHTAAQVPCDCAKYLIPQKEILEKTESKAELEASITVMTRESFASMQAAGQADLRLGLICRALKIKATATWEEFEKARENYFNEVNHHVSETSALKTLKEKLTPAQVNAALMCDMNCQNAPFWVAALRSTPDTVVVMIKWNPVGKERESIDVDANHSRVFPGEQYQLRNLTLEPGAIKTLQFICSQHESFSIVVNSGPYYGYGYVQSEPAEDSETAKIERRIEAVEQQNALLQCRLEKLEAFRSQLYRELGVLAYCVEHLYGRFAKDSPEVEGHMKPYFQYAGVARYSPGPDDAAFFSSEAAKLRARK